MLEHSVKMLGVDSENPFKPDNRDFSVSTEQNNASAFRGWTT